jgi:flagellar protein FliO/FliZ
MGDMYWRFVGALFLVVALIFAVAWIAKRLGLGGRITTARGKRRLSVQEVLPLDSKRRLVLLKRDGVEHLLLIGINDDLVVETGIAPPQDKPANDFAAMLPGAPS